MLLTSNYVFSQETEKINFKKLDNKIEKLNEIEIKLDSLYHSIFKSETKGLNENSESYKLEKFMYREYKKNLARDYRKRLVNDNLVEPKNKKLDWEPLNCDCNLIDENTIEIKLGFNFMCFWECNGHIINIKNDTFKSYYAKYRNDQDIYKISITDSIYKSTIEVKNQFSNLTLDKKLKFEHNEIIEGNLEYKTFPFFMKNGNNNDRVLVNGNIYFKCILKDKTEI
jgi:hypothetical protein